MQCGYTSGSIGRSTINCMEIDIAVLWHSLQTVSVEDNSYNYRNLEKVRFGIQFNQFSPWNGRLDVSASTLERFWSF